MSKTIRQKIAHAIQTIRSSSQDKQTSTKTKISSCCSVSKPKDYEYISYELKQSSTNNDYVDLSECHSWSLSYSKDSGISYDKNLSSISLSNENFHQFQSTQIHSNNSTSHLSLSNISSIPNDQLNISNFDVTAWYTIPTSFQCCRCHCHHHFNIDRLQNPTNNTNHLDFPQQHEEKRTKNQIFPFIF
ncbi:unnamed protein product [Rotaria sordida]|uniref:Uncharacterized protein n=1 Tax=Rotaria sordida TaxID=392033 RepID=A0A818NU81_9BILA|nr:unnamed protein product [Rotaria sordida]CAF3610460.1 unnamed protein product [Rotaria sordida]